MYKFFYGVSEMEQNAKENLTRVSDGKLYELHDMVKVGCHDCAGCSLCCQDMGTSITLDPYDAFQLTRGLHQTFEQLLTGPVELHVEDGLILPNLKMKAISAPVGNAHAPAATTACTFLDQDRRCSIHAHRPGLCRIFPLGRNYDGDTLNYFLLVNECPAENKTKMKVEKWIDTDRLRENQDFLLAWHDFTKKIRALIGTQLTDDALIKQLNMALLHIFYLTPYQSENFYAEFQERLEKGKQLIRV